MGRDDEMMRGRKGRSFLSHWPLPSDALKTRFSRKMLRPEYYGWLVIRKDPLSGAPIFIQVDKVEDVQSISS